MTTQRFISLYQAKWRNAPMEDFVSIYNSWARDLFTGMGFELESTGEKPLEEPCIYVGNHVSYLDIPLVWTAAQTVFVSKKEVRNWPVIGASAQELGTIWVDRSSMSSRAKVLDSMREGILVHKKRVCIFPEGTSSVEGTPWRWGAFKLAKDLGVPIQPFRIFYCPLRDTAYMGDDTLTTQWWKCMNSPNKLASLEWGKPTKITDFRADAQAMQEWVRASFEKKRAERQCE
jgi:1-acyl-sn-glycerol-3-phosphate acyltransferase